MIKFCVRVGASKTKSSKAGSFFLPFCILGLTQHSAERSVIMCPWTPTGIPAFFCWRRALSQVTLTCTRCAYSRRRRELYRDFSLDVPHHSEGGAEKEMGLSELLDGFFKPSVCGELEFLRVVVTELHLSIVALPRAMATGSAPPEPNKSV